MNRLTGIAIILITMSIDAGAQRLRRQEKMVVYQLLPRLFGNQNTTNVPFGTIQQNGSGKFDDITPQALQGLNELQVNYVWYTGVIAHASLTDYTAFGIKADDADVVKGRAGSPYAIRDYYDVDPDLAVNVNNRMKEFEALIGRTHAARMKVLIDFVPNHVARSYHSAARPKGVEDFGTRDNTTVAYSPTNDFYYLPGQPFQVPAGVAQKRTQLSDLQNNKFEENPAKVTGNNVFKAQPDINDWYETVKLNYGVDEQHGGKTYFDPIPPVWTKMRDILLFWANKGVDGFRCDVAEMVPVQFWSWVIPEVKKKHPDIIFLGEAYNPAAYALYLKEGKFDYLYDKVGLYDGLKRLIRNEQNADVRDISKVWQQESAGFGHNMLRFLENHDEERIASAGFAGDANLAKAAMVVTATLGSGPVMLYFGQEVGEPGRGAEGFGGEDNRTTIFDYWGVPNHQQWMSGGKFDGSQLNAHQRELRSFYAKLMAIAVNEEAFTGDKIIEVQPTGSMNNRMYAYFRYSQLRTYNPPGAAGMKAAGPGRALVAVNFDRTQTMTAEIPVPEEIRKLNVHVEPAELLTGKKISVVNNTIKINIPPGGAAIIAF